MTPSDVVSFIENYEDDSDIYHQPKNVVTALIQKALKHYEKRRLQADCCVDLHILAKKRLTAVAHLVSVTHLNTLMQQPYSLKIQELLAYVVTRLIQFK